MTRPPLGRYLLPSSRGPGVAAAAARSARRRPVPARRCRGGCRRAGTGTPAGKAGRHESSKVRAAVTTTRRSPLIRWPPQLAASQISAAARIATKNTTTITAAGIARSLRSCLCTSVPLAVDGAGHGAADEPGAAALGGFGCPGQRLQLRTYACSIRRCAPSPLGRAPRRPPPVRAVVPRGEAGWVLAGVACCPADLLVVGSRAVAGHPGSSPPDGVCRGSPAACPGQRAPGKERPENSARADPARRGHGAVYRGDGRVAGQRAAA